jgi:hypothetical protein
MSKNGQGTLLKNVRRQIHRINRDIRRHLE